MYAVQLHCAQFALNYSGTVDDRPNEYVREQIITKTSDIAPLRTYRSTLLVQSVLPVQQFQRNMLPPQPRCRSAVGTITKCKLCNAMSERFLERQQLRFRRHFRLMVKTEEVGLKPRLHDTTCCQTGLTTGCFVYTNIQPIVIPV